MRKGISLPYDRMADFYFSRVKEVIAINYFRNSPLSESPKGMILSMVTAD